MYSCEQLLCAYSPPEEENGLLFWEKTTIFSFSRSPGVEPPGFGCSASVGTGAVGSESSSAPAAISLLNPQKPLREQHRATTRLCNSNMHVKAKWGGSPSCCQVHQVPQGLQGLSCTCLALSSHGVQDHLSELKHWVSNIISLPPLFFLFNEWNNTSTAMIKGSLWQKNHKMGIW